MDYATLREAVVSGELLSAKVVAVERCHPPHFLGALRCVGEEGLAAGPAAAAGITVIAASANYYVHEEALPSMFAWFGGAGAAVGAAHEELAVLVPADFHSPLAVERPAHESTWRDAEPPDELSGDVIRKRIRIG